MTTIIDTPINISKKLFPGLLELIKTGTQVDPEGLEDRIMASDLIAFLLDNDKIVSTATLKNPLISYRNKVFKAADVDEEKENYIKEIGYIVTRQEYEGQKLCQQLLNKFIPCVDSHKIFATTRKPSIVHILGKYGFKKIGTTYNNDLDLLIYHGKK